MMRTRCPACQTLFRISSEQLRARQGMVRCGHCRHTFNALDTLDTEPAVSIAPAAPKPAARSSGSPVFILEDRPGPSTGFRAPPPEHETVER
ncbi:MAG: DUF3426 domain-containing protein, partial [Proteobacteria bacterium]